MKQNNINLILKLLFKSLLSANFTMLIFKSNFIQKHIKNLLFWVAVYVSKFKNSFIKLRLHVSKEQIFYILSKNGLIYFKWWIKTEIAQAKYNHFIKQTQQIWQIFLQNQVRAQLITAAVLGVAVPLTAMLIDVITDPVNAYLDYPYLVEKIYSPEFIMEIKRQLLEIADGIRVDRDVADENVKGNFDPDKEQNFLISGLLFTLVVMGYFLSKS